MELSAFAVERAMKIQEVILRAMSGELTWLRAADVLGMSPRSLRRWRRRMEEHGYEGLWDRRRRRPSPRRAPVDEVQSVLRLYRTRYGGFNVRHFHETAQREHGLRLSYSFVKKALQAAGLVKKKQSRGRHRKQRERRACFGEMLHLDGSPHAWLALKPDEKQTLIVVVDDATSDILYARLEAVESTATVMRALRSVIERYGLPLSLYTDQAGWAFVKKVPGGGIDKTRRTQVGRALETLGVEHIPGHSPQARGRSERNNRTLQDRLVNELRAAGIRTVPAANRYIEQVYLPRHRRSFAHPPRDPQSAFVALGPVDLDAILCFEETRVVGNDNTVVLDNVRMQIDKQPGRRSCKGLKVLIRRHLDRSHTVWHGQRCFGRFDYRGRPEQQSAKAA
jgi:transposase